MKLNKLKKPISKSKNNLKDILYLFFIIILIFLLINSKQISLKVLCLKIIPNSSTPSWLSAIGTVGTLIFTLIQLRIDKKERKDEKLKWQANKISSWIGETDPTMFSCIINNLSCVPIYDVALSIVAIQGADPIVTIEEAFNSQWGCTSIERIVPPGKFEIGVSNPGPGMSIRFSTEIAFKDINGNSWIRRSNGLLERINQNPIDYLNIPKPF